ncbi:MAG: large subunit ribosomal protein [Bacteroidota bacterium]|nr:large subunit ribosomal protein [Bacteroidota bacterium]
MVTKEKKRQIVAELIEKLKNTTGLYVYDFAKMTVADTIAFRKLLKDKGFEARVAKNTLIKRAIDEVGGFDIPAKNMFGQSGLIFSYTDPVAPAKIFRQYIEKRETPVLKAAVIEGSFYDGSQLKQLAELPTREEMISSIIGSIAAPISGIVGSVGAVMRDIAYLVEEVAKKQAA